MLTVVEGIVVPGDRRGRELGFPTANVRSEVPIDLPDEGVYAGYVTRADGTVHVSAISVGRRETFYEHGVRLVEAHLLDFDGDLYGERLRVEISSLVRAQRRFDSIEELVAQIARDVDAVRALAAASRLET